MTACCALPAMWRSVIRYMEPAMTPITTEHIPRPGFPAPPRYGEAAENGLAAANCQRTSSGVRRSISPHRPMMRLPPSASPPGTPPRSAMLKSWTTCARCWSRRNFPAVTRWSSVGRRRLYLPIPGLPKKGVNQLFACAVQHPNLHPAMARYARLAMREFEWYQNLADEACAMPGTFAVFALGLEGEPWCTAGVRSIWISVMMNIPLCKEKFIHAFIREIRIYSHRRMPVLVHGVPVYAVV